MVRSATNGRKSVLVCALHLATSTGHCSCEAGCWPNKFRNKYALLNLDFTKDRWIESFQGCTKNHKDNPCAKYHRYAIRWRNWRAPKPPVEGWRDQGRTNVGAWGSSEILANGEDFTNSYLIFKSYRNMLDIRTLVLYLVYTFRRIYTSAHYLEVCYMIWCSASMWYISLCRLRGEKDADGGGRHSEYWICIGPQFTKDDHVPWLIFSLIWYNMIQYTSIDLCMECLNVWMFMKCNFHPTWVLVILCV